MSKRSLDLPWTECHQQCDSTVHQSPHHHYLLSDPELAKLSQTEALSPAVPWKYLCYHAYQIPLVAELQASSVTEKKAFKI